MNLSIYTDMKVKYFTPDIFELDNLMSDPPIIKPTISSSVYACG